MSLLCCPQVLRRCKGAFELVDVSDHLTGLRRLPGMQRWRVKDRERWYDSWEEGKQVSAGLRLWLSSTGSAPAAAMTQATPTS